MSEASDDKNPNEAEPRKRRAYEPPALLSEDTFEREAVLGCGKMTGGVGLCVPQAKAS